MKEEIKEPKKCGCGKTQDPNGNCDGSHNKLIKLPEIKTNKQI